MPGCVMVIEGPGAAAIEVEVAPVGMAGASAWCCTAPGGLTGWSLSGARQAVEAVIDQLAASFEPRAERGAFSVRLVSVQGAAAA